MSFELSELFAMLGFGVGLAAFVQRAGQLARLRLAARAAALLRLPARRPRPGVGRHAHRAASRRARPNRLERAD